MKQTSKFSIINRIKSFGFAFNGLKLIFKTEHNLWIHSFATIVVIILGFYLNVNLIEWCVLVFAIGFVFVAEIVNSAIEYITDIVSPEININAKNIKDIAAAAVFVASLSAYIIGLIVFIPKIF